MPDYSLTITPFKQSHFDVELFDDFAQEPEDKNHPLLCDLSYKFKLKLDGRRGVEKVSVYVNGDFTKSIYKNGEIIFPERSGRIFLDCYGFVRLDFFIVFTNGATLNLHSAYLPVLIKSHIINDAIREMVYFIYWNCEEFLYDGDMKSRDKLGLKKSSCQTLYDRIKLAEKIAAVYEQSYSYFKTNCRFKIEKVPMLDQFEKLQQVTAPTLQYIAAHPEQLQQVKSTVGIRVGRRIFQPQKTLTLKNIPSRDIFENRAVLAFLKKILDDLKYLRDECDKRRWKVSVPKNFNDQYENSLYHIYYRQKIFLSTWGVQKLREKFKRLLKMYSDALQISPPEQFDFKPTPIFLSLPQYNRIFLCVYEWLNLGVYDFAKEDFMLSLAKNWQLYERYLLAKFLYYFKYRTKFWLVKKFRLDYPLANSLHKQPQCCNVFIFSDGSETFTIYYQPVIYSTIQKFPEAPNLYRNNSIAWNDGDGCGSYYYVPDFVVKFDDGKNPARYVIVDAKLSEEATVKDFAVKEFVFKYIFSISPVKDIERITGYCIVYGKCSIIGERQSVYDKKLVGKKIIPAFELLPFMEGIADSDNKLHELFNLCKI